MHVEECLAGREIEEVVINDDTCHNLIKTYYYYTIEIR